MIVRPFAPTPRECFVQLRLPTRAARRIALTGSKVALLTLAFGRPHPAAAQIASPLELRVPNAPTAASIDGRSILAYELHITNFSAGAQNIRRVEVIDDAAPARVLLTLEDTALANAMSRPGVSPPPASVDRARLGGGLRAVLFLWVPVSAGDPPSRIRHRLTIVTGVGDSAVTRTMTGGAVAVATGIATIAPPLRGGPWLAGNGPQSASGHRRALIPIDGTPAIAQRFAIDYVKLDTAGKSYSGDRLKNSSYYAHGVDALAVADGVVAAAKDSIPENIPGENSRAVPITLETVGGNHVIIDIGGGRYAFYAHLQPGSLRVKRGDRVRRGQVLGLVGNSGNSTEPHLHFHISDSPSPLGSEGLPYVHEQLDVVGRCKALFVQCAATVLATHRREMPSGSMMVRYP